MKFFGPLRLSIFCSEETYMNNFDTAFFLYPKVK
jgi:hypothetical protein